MNTVLRNILKLYRDSYAGHPKAIWVLTIMSFINRLGTMVVPFLTIYLNTELHYDLKQAGLLASSFGLGSLAGTFIGGRLSDRVGMRNVIVASLFCGGILLICLQWATHFYALFALLFTAAVFGEAYRPAMMASISDHVPKSETGRSIALLRLAVNLGMSAAPAIGGFIAATWNYTWLFWFDGLTCIAAAIYFRHVSRHWKKHDRRELAEMKALEKDLSPPAHQNRDFLLFILASLIMAFCFMQWFQSVPVFIKAEWGFDERYIGMLMAFSSLMIALIEMPIIHTIEQRGKNRLATIYGLAFIGLSFVPFLFPASLAWCFVAIFILTWGEMLALPLTNSIALNLSPQARRGEYMAWYWMTWSLVQVAGPTLGLSFADDFGFSSFWILLMTLSAIGMLINLYLLNKGKSAPAHNPAVQSEND